MHLNLRSRLLGLVWLLILIAFVALAIRASTGSVLSLDVSVAKGVQRLPSWLGRLFDFENWLGETMPLAIVTVVAALIFLWRRLRYEAALIVLSFVPRLADVLVKHLVSEPRPSPELVRVGYPHDNLSFPSGHVIGFTVVFGLVCLFAPTLLPSRTPRRCLQALCLLLVLTIWLARVWVGAHWPSDTIGGYLYGALCIIPATTWYWQRR